MKFVFFGLRHYDPLVWSKVETRSEIVSAVPLRRQTGVAFWEAPVDRDQGFRIQANKSANA